MAEETPQAPYATYFARRGIFEDDWRATTSPRRPWPIVLIHGTGHAKGIWEDLGAELRKDGWAVFAPDYGYRATGPLADSVDQLAAYVRQVLVATGGRRAILAGHSQGGLLATLLSFRDPQFTRHVVCLAAPNHGTNLGGAAAGLLRIPGTRTLATSFVQSYWGQSGIEQLTGSPVLEDLASRDLTAPGVTYTCIASRTDQLINPPSSCFLDDGGRGTVENIWVQDRFPQGIVLHENMATDRRVRALVREKLLALVNESFSGGAFLEGGGDGDAGDGGNGGTAGTDGADARADRARRELGEDGPGFDASALSPAALLSALMSREGFEEWMERTGLQNLQQPIDWKSTGLKLPWLQDRDDGGGDAGDGDDEAHGDAGDAADAADDGDRTGDDGDRTGDDEP